MDRHHYDTLDDKEVAAALGIERSGLYALIAARKFPPGIVVTAGGKKRKWLWLDITSYLHMASRIPVSGPELEPPKDEE